MPQHYDYDFIVIGSGFGGSVSAHRLTEKGYRVGVLEMGKRYRPEDFPASNWDLRRYLWLPRLKLHGSFRLTLFSRVFVLSGVGVGGGSLNYGNVLLAPPATVWQDPVWGGLKNWGEVMPTHYRTARKMLGVTTTPCFGPADELLREAAREQGFGDTFYPTEVAVYFGEKGKTAPDPFFGGEGPARTGCELCGGCMVGCRHDGKNTLDKNYLYFAEKGGAEVVPETMVTDVRPLNGKRDGSDGYEIRTVSSTSRFLGGRKVYRARGVVFAGGVLGTVRLLMQLKESGSLPALSGRLGKVVRTNSESIIGTRFPPELGDISSGVAIGSGIYIDEHTHVEAVRYSRGSDAMGLLITPLTNGAPGLGRVIAWLGTIVRHPVRFLRVANPIGMAGSTIILLVMQTHDSRISLRLKRSLLPPFARTLATEGKRIPTFIPQANSFAEALARQFNGIPGTSLTEILFNVPTTAHILGGAHMGRDPQEGVIDGENRVFNYRNMYVCDGSMIGANLGVNPSLTIAALTEQAMSHVPSKGEKWWELR